MYHFANRKRHDFRMAVNFINKFNNRFPFSLSFSTKRNIIYNFCGLVVCEVNLRLSRFKIKYFFYSSLYNITVASETFFSLSFSLFMRRDKTDCDFVIRFELNI